jgi:hypothetical protein
MGILKKIFGGGEADRPVVQEPALPPDPEPEP